MTDQMKIVLAFDKFKGSLTSAEAAEAAARGIRRVFPMADIRVLPTADGGEGTVDAMLSAVGGERVVCSVTPPHLMPGEGVCSAAYALLQDGSCVMEMAAASGLALVPEACRNPMHTSTWGTGEMILHALERGARRFLLGLGGSATNDGGFGMAAALGARFYDAQGKLISAPDGGSLSEIASADLCGLDPRLAECTFTVCCDVENPLCGPTGAAAVYAPQKGASAADVAVLDAGLKSAFSVLAGTCGTDVADVPGAGAAGGMGGGVMVFLGGVLTPGSDAVLDAVNADAHLSGAALLLTGEGKVDAQTVYGKTVCGLLCRAAAAGVPALVFGGCVTEEAEALYDRGAAGIFSLCSGPMTLEDSMRRSASLLETRVRAAVSCFAAGRASVDV